MPEVDLAKGVIVIAADALTEITAEGGDGDRQTGVVHGTAGDMSRRHCWRAADRS
ncbi:MAG: hypothetical protein R3C40_02115 [Parvularculaceae bacterium]